MLAQNRSLRCLELYASVGATLTDWKREAGEGFSEIEPVLVSTGQLARRWSRPGKPAMRIVDHGNGRAVAVCDDELSPPVELTHSDRVLYRPDGKQLRKKLGETFDLSSSRVIEATFPGLMHIGQWRTNPAVPIDVWLLVVGRQDQLVRQIIGGMPSIESPAMLLTPTRAYWPSSSVESLLKDGVHLVPIDDVLIEENGSWERLPAWDEFVVHLAPDAVGCGPEQGSGQGEAKLRSQVKRHNETEHHIIMALGEKGIVGLDGDKLPSTDTLAQWAGYQGNTSFKTMLSGLVKSGFLDNGSHHGRRGGYFLTPKGKRAADLLDQS